MAERTDGPEEFAGYLLVDIEGSVGKAERRPKSMRIAERRYRDLITDVVARHGGIVRDFAGDGVFVTLPADRALVCALAIQQGVQARSWKKVDGLIVRVAVHCGRADPTGEIDRVLANRVARILHCAWGGQILVSAAAVSACAPPDDAEFCDFGHHRFKGVEEPLRLFGLTHPTLARKDFPPPRSNAGYGAWLPPQALPIFGRAADIEALAALLSDGGGLITIVGGPGAGKSRLALELGASASDRRAVYFVSLENIKSGDAVLAAIATALSYPFHGAATPQRQLFDYLRDKRFLILLDNADGVVGEVGFLSRLGGPGVHFLATSREPLGVEGEVTTVLGGLNCGGPDGDVRQSPAFLLFTQSVHALGEKYELDDGECRIFSEICAEVSGAPLALHLIAHWTPVLSLSEILARLRTGLGFLHKLGGAPLQRGIERAVFGSWDLLDARQKQALAALSVFEGGWDLAAAEALGVPADMSAVLEAKRLIEKRGKRRVLHPFIREHAGERLRAAFIELAPHLQERHSDYFLEIVRQAMGSSETELQRGLLDRVDQELANVRAAWLFAVRTKPSAARGSLEALFYTLVLRAHLGECSALLSATTSDHPALAAHIQAVRASCEVQLGAYAMAEALAVRAMTAIGDDPVILAHCRHTLGNVAHARADFEQARSHYEVAFELRAACGDAMGSYYSAISLAFLNLHHDRRDAARAWVKRSFEFCHQAGQFGVAVMAYTCAGDIAVQDGSATLADENYRRALDVEQALNHPHLRAPLLVKLGAIETERGCAERARAHYEAALDVAASVGDRRVAVNALLGLAALLEEGDAAGARGLVLRALDQARSLAPPQICAVLARLARLYIACDDKGRAAKVIGLMRWPMFVALAPEESALAESLAPDAPVPPQAKTVDAAIQEILTDEQFGAPLLP
ncbi:ATP-binding protein [Terricaulis sp.]|uniref:ATP-binding protein n=1 Tax=Terricaulis sp. TaxID=2768686 RepID=UPI003782F3A9